jgi:hypothetical protein
MNRFLKIAFSLAFAASLANSSFAQLLLPQGRLTLASNTPVMTADANNVNNVYYTPYTGNVIPLGPGGSWANYTFSQLPLALSSTYTTSGNVYDLCVFSNPYTNAPILSVVTTPWASTASRGSSIGVAMSSTGILYESVSETTQFYTSATGPNLWTGIGYCTYVGSIYMTGNGETSVQFKPAAASGGSNNVVGLFNAYNRVRAQARSLDDNSSWTYASTTIRPADNSDSNRITFLDGLGVINTDARYQSVLYPANQGGAVAVGFNSTTAFGDIVGAENSVSMVQYNSEEGKISAYPSLGLNYVQALEAANDTNTLTFFGTLSGWQTSGLFLDTEY